MLKQFKKYDLVVGLNYYSPYISGLTEFARITAEECAARGMKVLVVTTQFDKELSQHEFLNGVEVRRYPVQVRIRNGVISFGFLFSLIFFVLRARRAQFHLPMLEAGVVSLLTPRVPKVMTYQCDYVTDHGIIGNLVRIAVDISSRITARFASHIVVTTLDYGRSSRISKSISKKMIAIPPPYISRRGGAPKYRESDGLCVGAMGRVVREKGYEYLIRAFRNLPDPDARLLIAGEYERIAGGSIVDELRDLADGDLRIRFLGFLTDEEMKDFYASIDVLSFASVNPLEAYGIVQLEAMSAGVPVIASDLPGVRVPVTQTGFGVIVEPRNEDAILDALVLFENKLKDLHSPDMELFESIDKYCELLGAPQKSTR